MIGQSHDYSAVPPPDTNSSWTAIELEGMRIKGGFLRGSIDEFDSILIAPIEPKYNQES